MQQVARISSRTAPVVVKMRQVWVGGSRTTQARGFMDYLLISRVTWDWAGKGDKKTKSTTAVGAIVPELDGQHALFALGSSTVEFTRLTFYFANRWRALRHLLLLLSQAGPSWKNRFAVRLFLVWRCCLFRSSCGSAGYQAERTVQNLKLHLRTSLVSFWAYFFSKTKVFLSCSDGAHWNYRGETGLVCFNSVGFSAVNVEDVYLTGHHFASAHQVMWCFSST